MKAYSRFLLVAMALTVGSNALAEIVRCKVTGVRHRTYLVSIDKDTLEMSVGSAGGFAILGDAKENRANIQAPTRYVMDFSLYAGGKLTPQHFALEEPSRFKGGSREHILHFVHENEAKSLPCLQ